MESITKLILTVKDIEDILSIGETKAYKLVKTPGFPVIKIGRHLRIPAEEFYLWIKKHCN